MAAYTFFWRGETWSRRARELAWSNSPITYIAGKASRPMVEFQAGDEIFIVNVEQGRIRLGGRLIAEGSPIRETEAKRRLGSDLTRADLYVLARTEYLDQFRAHLVVPQAEAFALELINTKAETSHPKRAPGNPQHIDGQTLRNPMRLTEKSANMLRALLNLPSIATAPATSSLPVEHANPVSVPLDSVNEPAFVEQENKQTDESGLDSGQGLMMDPEARRAIEVHAVALAKEHYLSQGFQVVEFGKPFDLLCTKGELEIHVEVKGTLSSGSTVRLTCNEVSDARAPNWRSDLFIVSGIRLLRDQQPEIKTEGGSVRLIEGWHPLDEDLTPTEFEYRVPKP